MAGKFYLVVRRTMLFICLYLYVYIFIIRCLYLYFYILIYIYLYLFKVVGVFEGSLARFDSPSGSNLFALFHFGVENLPLRPSKLLQPTTNTKMCACTLTYLGPEQEYCRRQLKSKKSDPVALK